MATKELLEDWHKLLGPNGMELAIPPTSAADDVNHLEVLAQGKGMRQGWHYLLSERFEHCGLVASKRDNFTPVLHAAMCRAMEAASDAKVPPSNGFVLVAPSPYRQFGAEVTRVPNGYLLMVSPTTFPFCFLYAILAVTSAQATGLLQQGRVVRGEDDQALIDPLEWACASHRALYSAIDEYLSTGTIEAPLSLVQSSRFDLLPWHYVERVQRTYEQMLDFLVLHEFGHIVLKHVSGAETVRRAIPGTSIAYDAVKTLTSQEEAADDFALKCLVGSNNAAELCKIADLLDSGDANTRELDKVWAGRTSIARYTSCLQMIKLFDVIESFQIRLQPESGMRLTDLCQVSGTHPSGQHRLIRAIAASKDFLNLPEGYLFNVFNILDWQSFLNITQNNQNDADVQREWRELTRAA